MTDKFAGRSDNPRLYIVGDIHGRADLLDQMAERIAQDVAQRDDRDCLTITLGDYVDRGLDSRSVLDRLSRNPFPTEYIALKGNHEELLERFLQDPSVAESWRRLGGLETLQSYGVSIDKIRRGRGFEEASRAFDASLPDTHRKFLSSLKESFSIGECFLCHAGVRPGIPLDHQIAQDLFWIRDEFLNCDQKFDKMIIHGHTPNEWPDVRPNRVNIDTGAFATNRLTCLIIEDGRGRFLFTS